MAHAQGKPHLFERLCGAHELEAAWRDVLAHYPKANVPAGLREFDRHRGRLLESLSAALRAQAFLPEPASLIFIPKPNHPGERRPISLLRPEDRIVLTALNRILTPIFDRQFLPHSFAYRPGLGAAAAVDRVSQCLVHGLVHAAAGDIDDFFSNIDRPQLLRLFAHTIYEQPILDLLEAYLHIGAARDLEWADSGRGVAQGSPLSPLLSNIALAEFDRYLDGLPAEWIRYADNFLLLAQDPAIVHDAFTRAEAFLLERCGLRLNPESRILAAEQDGFDFLGFTFRAGRRVMAQSKLDEKRLRIADLLRRSPHLAALIPELNESVKGWRAYYGASPDTREQLAMLEQHLADLLAPWLEKFRSQGPGAAMPAAALKAALIDLELPATQDARRKLKWIELVLARSRAKKEQAAQPASALARRAVAQRKLEYRKLKQERQEVVITRPGTYLGRTGERLLIRREGKRESELPFSLVHNITLLTKAVSLSGDLMAEAAARGINIVIAGSDGRPAVRIGPPEIAEHQLSLAQSTLASSVEGLELARIVVAGKVRNQANLLRYYLKYPERRADGDFLSAAAQAVEEMEQGREKLLARAFESDLELERNRLFAAEGQAAASYWAAVKTLLWWKPGFEGRVRRGAGDLVNSMLNYGYGILYSRLLTVLLRAGLNVYIGFLHKPQQGKAGLLYDFIEEFRAPAVDRAVFGMLNLGVEAHTDGDGLTDDTRHELARKVVRRLQSPTRYHGESLPLEQVMELQARLLVRHIQKTEQYRTYVLPW